MLARPSASRLCHPPLVSPNPPSFPSSLAAPAGPSLSLGFRHTGRAQLPPACLLRKDLTRCPLPLGGSEGSITTSPSTASGEAAVSTAGTPSLCHARARGELRAEGRRGVRQQGKASPLKKSTGESWMLICRRASDPPHSLGEGGSPGTDQGEPRDGVSWHGGTGDGLLGVKPSVSWLRVRGMNCNHQPINENIQTNKQK